MKKLLLKKLKADFKKAGFIIVKINFTVNYRTREITTDAEQENGKGIKKTEPLNDDSAMITQLMTEVKKQITFDELHMIILKCDLLTFDVKADLFYSRSGENLKKEIAV